MKTDNQMLVEQMNGYGVFLALIIIFVVRWAYKNRSAVKYVLNMLFGSLIGISYCLFLSIFNKSLK